VNLLEIGLSADRDSKEERFRVFVGEQVEQVVTKERNQLMKMVGKSCLGRFGLTRREGRVRTIADISVGEPCGLLT